MSTAATAREGTRGEPPPYCCAILYCPERGYLLEQRPMGIRDAPGMITCFGGGREQGEVPEECVRRELHEELGIDPGPLSLRVRFFINNRETAWFFEGAAPRTLEGATGALVRRAVWVSAVDLGTARLSGWHRPVLLAHAAACGSQGVLTVHLREGESGAIG